MTAKILVLDIERQSALIDGVWDLFEKRVIQPHQIVEPARTICFSWKWLGDAKTRFTAEWDTKGEQDNRSVTPGGGHRVMVDIAHELLDEADYVVGYNSKKFDMGHLRAAFVAYDHLRAHPPSPWTDIDLYLQLTRVANGFMSRRLAYISEVLGLEGKAKTGGMDLWRTLRWADGDVLKRAQRHMKKYNLRDVDLTEELYFELLPWLNGINLAALDPTVSKFDFRCPNCNSGNVRKKGSRGNLTYTYQRYLCNDCGKWSKDRKSIGSTGLASI